VDRDDGGHDASVSSAHDIVLFGTEPQAERTGEDISICYRLSSVVDRIQLGGSRGAMGASIDWLGIAND
jgi:hypothetical protein